MSKILSIDLETYSDINIEKSGLYRYAENSEILLFAYAFDDEPVEIVDVARGEDIPGDVLFALNDPDVLKTAYNAAFEMHVIDHYIQTVLNTDILQAFDVDPMDPMQWYCTMIQAWTLGLPGGLANVGRVLNLSEDKQKLATGKRLIQYFSKPCKATKANGGRIRNRPEHDIEKWELFKEYCKQDVEAERAIRKRLETFPPIDTERKLWNLDQEINDRGVLVDWQLVKAAIQIDAMIKQEMMDEAQQLTGLANPNSNQQVLKWFEKQEGWMPKSLDKAARTELMEQDISPKTKQLLKCKELLSKSSVKKYITMEQARCSDKRIHGMLQFYGASRTGRWAGRLVQLHNLPQNHMDDLDDARGIVRSNDYDTLSAFYDNPPDVLSQLIRTAFIAPEGKRFIVADFSAIEARVIAWIADEKWRMDTFKNGGDIYCASASAMFKVPVVKHGENGHLRAKGKIAELACGYGGGVSALMAFGADKMGLTEQEMDSIVKKWRATSPNIPKLWKELELCFKKALRMKTRVKYRKGIEFSYEKGIMFVQLPSGRRIAYVKPRIEFEERFNRESLTYEGTVQGKSGGTSGWGRNYTWGGKLTENCIAEGTLVLTNRGLIPIEDIKENDLIWDGVEMVQHEGLICLGLQSVLRVDSFYMTPNHKILTQGGWKYAEHADRLNWHKVSLPNGFKTGGEQQSWKGSMALPVRMRETNKSNQSRPKEGQISNKVVRMHEEHFDICGQENTWNEPSSGLCNMAFHEAKMHGLNLQSMEELWWQRNPGMQSMDAQFQSVLGGHGIDLQKGVGSGSYRQQQGVQPGKLSMDNTENQLPEQTSIENRGLAYRADDNSGAIGTHGNRSNNNPLSSKSSMADRITVDKTGDKKQIYDIRNCGPRHRYAIWDNKNQRARLVHNCVQATARDCLATAMLRLDEAGYQIVMHIHDEVVLEMPYGQGSLKEVCDIMGTPIPWAPGLLLTADGYETTPEANYYRKD